MANGVELVLSSHNPLVLGSNPSGPSLPAKTETQRIRDHRRVVASVKLRF
jgi:hypothetical protein